MAKSKYQQKQAAKKSGRFSYAHLKQAPGSQPFNRDAVRNAPPTKQERRLAARIKDFKDKVGYKKPGSLQ